MIIKIPGKGPLTIYSDSEIVLNIPGDNPVEVIAAPVAGGVDVDNLLLEIGDALLLESGDQILLEA
jgi:hypothetical protein